MSHLAGTLLPAGIGYSTILPNMDFETYSEAGYVWDSTIGKWRTICEVKGKKGGILSYIGGAVYAEHPSTEVLCLAYDLKDGMGPHLWVPKSWDCKVTEEWLKLTGVTQPIFEVGPPGPVSLFGYLQRGGLIEAHNSAFEYRIWNEVCVKKYGWPPLPLHQLRCSQAKAKKASLPPSLGDLSKVLNITHGKDADGSRLIKKFSIPGPVAPWDPVATAAAIAREEACPTVLKQTLFKERKIRDVKAPVRVWQPWQRTFPHLDPVDGPKLYQYCLRDIEAESEISELLPDLPSVELDLWLLDQRINMRGVRVDEARLDDCLAVMNQVFARYEKELAAVTGGAVLTVGQSKETAKWLTANGCPTESVDKEAIEALITNPRLPQHPDVARGIYHPARRVLEIRQILAYSSVKKAVAAKLQLDRRRRLQGLFSYCGALRTDRFTGVGPQPQNFPNSGPDMKFCENGCENYYKPELDECPWCGMPDFINGVESKPKEWEFPMVEGAFYILQTRSLEIVEYYYGDALALISGCLRSLFIPAEGRDLICADYSAIEAVVGAAIAGEEWRLEVFRTHGKIYETSISKITGTPLDVILKHKTDTGSHHPLRKRGKVAELASGFGGGVAAWKRFGADKYYNSDEEIKEAVDRWRRESPAFSAQMWRDGYSGIWEGLEIAAKSAVKNPGQCFEFRGISYGMRGNVLYCRLLSGDTLQYHNPRVVKEVNRYDREVETLYFEGWNNNPANGAMGWIVMSTWGGKLFENVVQKTARDILTHALVNLDRAGYDIVLHVHDEPVAEVDEGKGSTDEFKRIMVDLPWWCHDWPVRVGGEWRGKRYRK
jgi:DNA polymerase bacteriophage-type